MFLNDSRTLRFRSQAANRSQYMWVRLKHSPSLKFVWLTVLVHFRVLAPYARADPGLVNGGSREGKGGEVWGGGCAPSPEIFWIFIPKWRIFVHSANDVGMAPGPPGSALAHRRNLREYEGYRYPCTPTFWTEGYLTPTFQDENVKILLSSAVNRGDLRRLNYYKLKPFSAGALPRTPLRGLKDWEDPDPWIIWEGYPPIFLPSRLGTKGRLVLHLNLYPSLFRPN